MIALLCARCLRILAQGRKQNEIFSAQMRVVFFCVVVFMNTVAD
jgi:hypothetical protein